MIKEEIFRLTLPYSDNQTKLVRVFVPEHEEGEKLPVIYMTDGQSIFEDGLNQFGSWHTRKAVRAERQNSGKAAVIVGIHNDESPVQRANDLTPKSIGELFFPPDMPEEMKKQINPKGEVFDDFIVNTVMPAVEKQFPVKTGKENTAICGSSSGGIQTFFTALSHPDIFSAAGVFSPCFMLYCKPALDSWIKSKAGSDIPFLYIYSGSADELEKIICMSVEGTFQTLSECCPQDKLKKVIMPEQHHNEAAWEPVFRDFLSMFLT